MNRDFKFLADPTPPKKPGIKASLRKPKKQHVLAFAAISTLLVMFINLAPDNASAHRNDELQVLALPEQPEEQADVLATNTSTTMPWQLPPEIQSQQTDTKLPVNPEPKGKWKTVKVKRGDNLARIFSRLGISPDQLHEIMQLGKTTKRLKTLYPGETFKVRIDTPETQGKTSRKKKQLEELVYAFDVANSLRVLNTANGFQAEKIKKELEVRQKHVAGKINDSLFLAGQRAGMSDNLIMELAGIFGWIKNIINFYFISIIFSLCTKNKV